MTAPADRMKAMRHRRRAQGLREVHTVTPDPRTATVRQRVARQVANLHQANEADALRWNEAVSEFDMPEVSSEQ